MAPILPVAMLDPSVPVQPLFPGIYDQPKLEPKSAKIRDFTGTKIHNGKDPKVQTAKWQVGKVKLDP